MNNCALIETSDVISWVNSTITSNEISNPIVALSIYNDIKFLENLNQELKRIIACNKYRSEVATWPKSNNLDYMIYSTFRNFIKLCVPSFKAGNDNLVRESHKGFYLKLLKTKDFNALIEYKPFFDQSIKNKEEAYRKQVKT